MRKAVSALVSCLVLTVLTLHGAAAPNTIHFAVRVSASVETSPPRIILSWPQDGPETPQSYLVFRKAPGDASWGKGTRLAGTATSYVDSKVKAGVAYEYQVLKRTAGYSAYGYVLAGIELPLAEDRGKVLLVVERACAQELAAELAQLREDLVGDGWQVVDLEVGRHDSVQAVKRRIQHEYFADPVNVNCVFHFGHVPVPYSGNIVPDGHAPEHQGAWPCDGYYGDMDGQWTDESVNTTAASDRRNHNVPGDGKFDQSHFPGAVELMVGRVDLANMPGRLTGGGSATFPGEIELLRNYLAKNHRFRTRQFQLPRRALVGDYFGIRDGEAFAASGWRNFSSFFGADLVSSTPESTWISTLSTNAHLWAYGCGPGTFTSIGGFGTANRFNDGLTTDLVRADIQAVFTLLFGSWLGDWDAEDDLLRSVLATSSYGLTAAWSGRPHWFVHHMALGAPIGFSARLTQNNREAGLYRNHANNGAGQVHIALMGDPTLRMHMVAPPTRVRVETTASGLVLCWAAAEDAVLGYHVYEAPAASGPFRRVTAEPVLATTWPVENGSSRAHYMVRALKLESSASGTYYNLSQGAWAAPSPATPQETDSTLAARKP